MKGYRKIVKTSLHLGVSASGMHLKPEYLDSLTDLTFNTFHVRQCSIRGMYDYNAWGGNLNGGEIKLT